MGYRKSQDVRLGRIQRRFRERHSGACRLALNPTDDGSDGVAGYKRTLSIATCGQFELQHVDRGSALLGPFTIHDALTRRSETRR